MAITAESLVFEVPRAKGAVLPIQVTPWTIDVRPLFPTPITGKVSMCCRHSSMQESRGCALWWRAVHSILPGRGCVLLLFFRGVLLLFLPHFLPLGLTNVLQ